MESNMAIHVRTDLIHGDLMALKGRVCALEGGGGGEKGKGEIETDYLRDVTAGKRRPVVRPRWRPLAIVERSSSSPTFAANRQ